jgi:predicted TIM-barrel fold metal-dependent hydrolase
MATCQTVSSSPWSNAAVILTAAGALVFVLAYAVTTRGAWRRSMVGVNVMTLMAAITIVSALAVAGIVWGSNWPHRDVIRTAAWGSIGACIWWRVLILFRVQHADNDTTP